jgi:hypothetical protein
VPVARRLGGPQQEPRAAVGARLEDEVSSRAGQKPSAKRSAERFPDIFLGALMMTVAVVSGPAPLGRQSIQP